MRPHPAIQRRTGMTLHRNARTCPSSRRLIAHRVIDEGWTLAAAAEAAGVSVPTARKWVRRYCEAGESGLEDRSSAPRRVANRTAPERIEAIRSLRALRFTGEEIAELLAMAPSTVSLVLKREGLGRLPRPNASEPERRYERARAGELVHVDVKKLGRIDGVGHRISGRYRGHHRARGAGWTTCTSASTTRPGSPTPRCSQTSAPRPRSPSCDGRLAISPPWGSRSSG